MRLKNRKQRQLKRKRLKEIRLNTVSHKSNLMPFHLRWYDLNPKLLRLVNEIFNFLGTNYIEDSDCFFRLTYPQELIKLAIQAPNWCSFLNLGIRFERGRFFIGFITSILVEIIFKNLFFPSAEVNFLCLEKRIRKKGLVSSLIKEETRRLNSLGIIQAIYTTGLAFPESIVKCKYFHLPLNHLRLARFGFQSLSEFKPRNYNQKLWKIKTPYLNSFLLNIPKNVRFFFSKFKIYKFFDKKSYFHWFKSVPGVIYGFENFFSKERNVSFFLYSLPNKILKRKKEFFLFPIYLYQNLSEKKEIKNFFDKILSVFYQMGFDVFNILEGNLDKTFLFQNHFREGTGSLQFHFFNWKYHNINPRENGLVFF